MCEGKWSDKNKQKKKCETTYYNTQYTFYLIDKVLSAFIKLFVNSSLEMVPPPPTDQDWQFDKFSDGGSKGKRDR